MTYEKFFLEEVPSKLKQLKEDSTPHWGSMSAPEMLEHLCLGIRMSLENTEGEITTPEEKLPGYKQFLMSDRPFGRNLQAPEFFERHKREDAMQIDDLKLNLMKALVEMQSCFEKNEAHTAVHPSFGRLSTEEWKHLHKKHILHHFSQFGLIQEDP